MNKKEAEFLAKLMATFKIEAEEHLKMISDGLLALEKGLPSEEQKELLENIFREAHSLKGAARSINFQAIEKICQAMENVMSALKQNRIKPSPALFDTLYASLDLIGKFTQNAENQQQAPNSDLLIPLTEKLHQLENNEAAEEQPPLAASAPKPGSLSAAISADDHSSSQSSVRLEASPQLEQQAKPAAAPSPEPVKAANESPPPSEIFKDKIIRVSSQKLDRLLQQVEEMLIVKLTAGQRLNDFKGIQDSVRQWEKEWTKMQTDWRAIQSERSERLQNGKPHQSLKRLGQFIAWQQEFLKDFHEGVNKLTRAAAQDYRVLGGMVDGLLEDTKKVLMQPFSTLLDAFPRMVRDISKTLGKTIQLDMHGGDIEIDRRILDELKDPLLHLIRNSIDHGIEKLEERARYQKPPAGTITLAASQVSSNSVEITISDDGQGIDIGKVKQSALKQGIISEKDLRNLDEQDLLKLIFQSGVSTSPIITELSGRGLGLGIVSEKVEKLGGQIFIETKRHMGTTFRIVLPLTLATFRGIHIRTGRQNYIIPTQNVKRVLRVAADSIKTIEGKETIIYEGKNLSFMPLADLLGLSYEAEPSLTILILIVKAGDTLVAIGVEQVLNEQEVLVKGLGKQLLRIKNIAAATVMEWGTVIPILDPFDLIKSMIKGSGYQRKSTITQEAAEVKAKSILIAEDSVTARILLKNILESAGYHVTTAVDGAEAFSTLKTESFDLLLSDVEMPRMDGFELTEKVRHTEDLKEMPIVLCTSRGSKEDREHGIEVGANAYIDKSSFAHSNLLDIIQKLL